MTTRELRELLLKLDPGGEMEVICTRCSDYEAVAPEAVSVVRGVKKSSACYIMRGHPKMAPEDAAAERDFVHFEGN